MKIVISAGHGKYVQGADALINEVDSARRVVEATSDWLRQTGHDVVEFYDDVSTTQDENLARIVDFHNAQTRDLDVSVHFNSYEDTEDPVGTECLYLTQEDLAGRISATIAQAGGLIDRGPKYRDLYFLNNTEAPAVLIEVCFVDSETDVELYQANFEQICEALGTMAPYVDREPVRYAGKVSWFGGPNDEGVSPDEGLAFLYEYEDAPNLFLPVQPLGTTGLARRLDPTTPYVACRWDYNVTPKEMLADRRYRASVAARGRAVLAWPADWGPNENTGRVADVSPSILDRLGISTDDEVVITYPARISR